MYTEKGIPYIPTEGEAELLLDEQMQEMCQKDLLPEHCQWQRGCCPKVIREDSKVIQTELYGRCVVINGYMNPITDFGDPYVNHLWRNKKCWR